MGWTPFAAGTSCESRIHGHVTVALAEKLVGEDQAEWLTSTWTTRRGKEVTLREPAIRMKGKKSWKGRPSGIGDGSGVVMTVMQLVD